MSELMGEAAEEWGAQLNFVACSGRKEPLSRWARNATAGSVLASFREPPESFCPDLLKPIQELPRGTH